MRGENFRGIKKVVMINVIEGDGKNTPLREVHYIFDLDEHGGTHGGLVGKIDNWRDQGAEVNKVLPHEVKE